MRTILVIPCYNEAARLSADAFLSFVRRNADVDLLFVNDGSRDETTSVLSKLSAESSGRCGVLDLERNQGKAEAVRRGVLAALAEQPRAIGYWDADLATPLEAVLPMCDVLRRRPEIEWVVGARIALLGRNIERKPIRRVLGRLFARAASRVLGVAIYDTQCGAKLLRVSPETRSLFSEPFSTKWIFDVELLARMATRSRGASLADVVYEFPLDAWRDVEGSKVRAKDFVRAIGELWDIWRRYRRPPMRERNAASMPADSELPNLGKKAA